MTQNIKLMQGDCLELMNTIPDKSIDLICVDPPYGKYTHNSWDNALPFDKMWKHYKRIIKDNGAIVIFGSGMFTADLMRSNSSMWRYNLIWDKQLTSGFLNANRQPLRRHEDICVFYKKQPTYNPQFVEGFKKNHGRGRADKPLTNNNYNDMKFVDNREQLGTLKHPTSILSFQKTPPSKIVHPTQKSVELLEWIIKTYTNEGETVLDNTMGSGSTGVACVRTNRNFIGIELDEKYFKIAEERIGEAHT